MSGLKEFLSRNITKAKPKSFNSNQFEGELNSSDAADRQEVDPDKYALRVATQDAAARNIKNGQQVKAWNDLSSVIFEAVVTDAIAPGNVVSEGIFRRDTTAGGRSFNALTSQRLSDLGEGTTMNDNRVEVCGL